jgi:hypothetical protein
MIKFTEEIITKPKLFEDIDLVPLDTYNGMDTHAAWEFKTPMATGFYKPYVIRGSNKIEKITFGELHYIRRAIYSAINMTASDDYDLPVFSVEFDESAPRIGVTVDLMPLVDIAVHPEYQEKYLAPLAGLWRKYRTIPGLTKEGRCLVQRRYAPWHWARESLSPFSLDGRIEEPEDRVKILAAIIDYARVWLDLLKKAEPIKDPAYKQEMLTRKRTLQKFYRDRDPGGEVIKKIFGEEKQRLFVSLIF